MSRMLIFIYHTQLLTIRTASQHNACVRTARLRVSQRTHAPAAGVQYKVLVPESRVYSGFRVNLVDMHACKLCWEVYDNYISITRVP